MQRKYFYFLIIVSLLLFLANSGSHPVTGTAGYTGAPGGDSVCSTCHTGSNGSLDGNVTIDGLPTEVITNETYTLTITVTNPNGNANEAGFQLLALTGSNMNAGSMSVVDPATTEVKMVSGGKQYFGHSPSQTFPGSNTLSFDVEWTAPTTTGVNPIVKFYASAVIANGNNQNNQDRVVTTNVFVPIVSGVDPLEIDITNIISASCFDSSDGSATVDILGGTSPYDISWSSGETNNTATQISAGTFSVTVTDANNITASASQIMPSPTELSLFCSGTATCIDVNNGTASISAAGGTPEYTFIWDNGEITSAIENLTGGAYQVTVTDANNCTASTTCFVEIVSPFSIVPTINNVLCFGQNDGSIFLNIVGAQNPVEILWNTGSTTSSILNLEPSNYTVTVVDNAGCEVIDAFTINEPELLQISALNIQNATCNNSSDGAINISINGGSLPYSYDWSNGSKGQGSNVHLQNLSVGTYIITVSDLFDCTLIDTFIVNGPEPIHFDTILHNNISCFGETNGSIVFVPDSLENVGYLWSTGSIDSMVQNLSVGKYFVTLTDSTNLCTYQDSFDITAPTELVLFLDYQDSTCINNPSAQIILSATGGTQPYTFLWGDGYEGQFREEASAGTYQITFTDYNACFIDTTISIQAFLDHTPTIQLITAPTCIGSSDGVLAMQSNINPIHIQWSNGDTTNTIENLNPGNFSVTISDSKGCEFYASYVLETSNAISLQLDTLVHIPCFGDSTGFIAIDSLSNFTLNWSNGITGYTADNLPAGTYTIQGEDALGCKTQELEVEVLQNERLFFQDVVLDSVLCVSDSISSFTFNISGGISPYSILWNGVQIDTFELGLPEGQHNFVIMDSLGCSTSVTYTVIRSDSIRLDSIDLNAITCYREANGHIYVNASGGWLSLDYTWSNGAFANEINNLSAGMYELTISDEAGCIERYNFEIDEPDSMYVTETITHETVAGHNDGKAELEIQGGTPPYSVQWSNNMSGVSIDSLAPGFITYTIYDQNNCSKIGMVLINGGACDLAVNYAKEDAHCFNSNDGKITLDIDGNFENYEVTIYNEFGIINTALDSLYPGNYTIFVKDSIDCLSIIQDIEVGFESPKIIIDSLHIANPSSNSSNDGSILVEISGGVAPYQVQWYKFGTLIGNGESISEIGIGLYSVQIVDDAGCTLENNSIFVTATVDSEDLSLINTLTLYPNPTSGNLSVKFAERLDRSTFEIFDLLGNKIHQGTITNTNEIQLSEIELATCMYILHININGKPLQKPFIYLGNK
ncbi:MAG: choice-of-anchor V domain-containing protein [Saprospiraceae bacterium]